MPITSFLLCHLICLRCPTSPVLPPTSHQKRLIAACAWGSGDGYILLWAQYAPVHAANIPQCVFWLELALESYQCYPGFCFPS